MILDLEQTALW